MHPHEWYVVLAYVLKPAYKIGEGYDAAEICASPSFYANPRAVDFIDLRSLQPGPGDVDQSSSDSSSEADSEVGGLGPDPQSASDSDTDSDPESELSSSSSISEKIRNLCVNPAALQMIMELDPELWNWKAFNANPAKIIVDMLKENPEKIDWYTV